MNQTQWIWYWRRLGRMSMKEKIYRVKNLIYARIQAAGWLTAAKVPKASDPQQHPPWPPRGVGTIDSQPYVVAAEKILAGKLDVFRLEGWSLGNPPQWNVDPLTGRVPPLTFGPTLNYRDEALVGDIKYLWEPSRHLHLVTLAQAWRLTGDGRYLAGIALHLTSWLEQAPYLRGPHWTSALELGIRLINWALVWRLTGGATQEVFLQEGLRQRWLESIYQHAHFIRGHFSAFSSANNHLIGEAAGLYVASVTWPCWPRLVTWGKKARKVLIEQALCQNAPDGVNREQAVSYQQFVLDFLIIAALLGEEQGRVFPQNYWDRIERMLEFLAALVDVSGNIPMIGDADDGYVVRLSQEEGFDCYRSLLATGGVLFVWRDLWMKAGKLDHKTRWLLGDRSELGVTAREPTDTRSLAAARAFPDGGYHILSKNHGQPEEIHVVVDTGPLGYLSLAAHGHADALSVMLSVAGKPILVDPGTYAYHTQKKWRDYFRGTAAHNTLRVDGCDQSLSGGNFMWQRHAQVYGIHRETGEGRDRIQASHDGYKHLPSPVVHQREVLLVEEDNSLQITDHVETPGEHKIERFWHFHPQCQVSLEGNQVLVVWDDVRVVLTTSSPETRAQIHRGEEDPPLGWISYRFDVKEPTVTVVFTDRIRGTTQLATRMAITSGKS